MRALMEAKGLSQSELARRVGVSQSAIHKLVSGAAYNSAHLHKIARELATSSAYLADETDDLADGAPTPPDYNYEDRQLLDQVGKLHPDDRAAVLKIASAMARPNQVPRVETITLPSQPALAEMFEGLLMALPENVPQAEHARLLAKWLPIGLAQLRDLQPHDPTPGSPIGFPASSHPQEPGITRGEALAIPDRERR